MTKCEVSATIDQLIGEALEAHDDRLAAVERRFCNAVGLNRDDDATAWALGDLAMAVGDAYMQAAFSAFWAGYKARAYGR